MTGFEEDLRRPHPRRSTRTCRSGASSARSPTPPSVVETARAVPGVASAEPLRLRPAHAVARRSTSPACWCRGIPPERARPIRRPRRRACASASIADLDRTFAVPLARAAAPPCSCPASSSAPSWRAKLRRARRRRGQRRRGGRRHAPACRACGSFVVVGEVRLRHARVRQRPRLRLASPTRSGSTAWQRLVTGIEVKVRRPLPGRSRSPRSIAGTLGSGYRVRDWMEANQNLFAALTAAEDGVLRSSCCSSCWSPRSPCWRR